MYLRNLLTKQTSPTSHLFILRSFPKTSVVHWFYFVPVPTFPTLLFTETSEANHDQTYQEVLCFIGHLGNWCTWHMGKEVYNLKKWIIAIAQRIVNTMKKIHLDG